MVGLGTMGSALLLNMVDKGHRVAGLDLDPEKVAKLKASGIDATTDTLAFIQSIQAPRPVMILVPAGKAVDSVIQSLVPHLEPGDFIIDGGNSYFKDTNRRIEALAASGIGFMGMGVSGGEAGARKGPSMMPGGSPADYERVRTVFEAIAARYDGEPCVARVGSGSAGHYVKTVHNGIEYGMMQLIAEAYDLMRRGLNLSLDQIADTFDRWNQGRLGGFLMEITTQILRYRDSDGIALVDVVSDKAKAKGTGKWTSQDAMDLGVPIPSVDSAVAARMLSAYKSERLAASANAAKSTLDGPDPELALWSLEGALHLAFLATYAQGLAQIRIASTDYGYDVDLQTVAKIWRAGCIIRSKQLEPIRAAYERDPGLSNLLLDPSISESIRADDIALRNAVLAFVSRRIPSPTFSASLAYLDGYRSVRLPANLIQAQRDLFGAHTFERIDRDGTYHSDWGSSN